MIDEWQAYVDDGPNAAPAEPVTATGLADEIAFRLQAAILDGEYGPGTRLQQEELCSRFGVSRTPVREALRKLQAQHLVDLVPNKGATVRIPSRAELGDVYALRSELEGFAAELAAARFAAWHLQALDAAQAAMDEAISRLESSPPSPPEEPAFNAHITAANERFHGVVHVAADNQPLRQYLLDLQGFFPKDYVWRAISSADVVRALSVDEHLRIRDALAGGQPRRARRAMSDHVAHSGRLLMAYLDGQGFWQRG